MDIIIHSKSVDYLKSSINRCVGYNWQRIKELRKIATLIDFSAFKNSFSKSPRLTINGLREDLEIYIPYDASHEDIKKTVNNECDYRLSLRKKLISISNGISANGFKNVTYGLPALPLLCTDKGVVLSFLMLTGIKLNAEKKQEDDHRMDPLEKTLFEYEKKMAMYINDEFTIEKEDFIPFIKLYHEYLGYYHNNEKVYSFSSEGIENKNFNMFFMGIYFIFCNTNYLSDDEMLALLDLFNYYKYTGVVDIYEALKLSCDVAFYEIAKKEKELQEWKRQVTEYKKYTQNGHVVESCDLDVFTDLISKSILDEHQKEQLVAEMRELCEKEANDARKESLLSDEEWNLYYLARMYAFNDKAIREIDAVIDLLVETKDEEERLDLSVELDVCISALRRSMASINEEGQIYGPVVYYKCSIDDDGTEMRIPLILKSLLSSKMSPVTLENDLNCILDGTIGRDKKIKVIDSLPCNVYYKGRDFPIFYTKVGDVKVIIDVGTSEDAHLQVAKTVETEDFQNFLSSVRKSVESGNVPNTSNCTKLLYTAINNDAKVKKLSL